MGKEYLRRPEMATGGPFRCYNCGKMLVTKVNGNIYELTLKCPRCKAEIFIKMKEAIPFKLKNLKEVQKA